MTGEYSCIMMKVLKKEHANWYDGFCREFSKRQLCLSQNVFRKLNSRLATALIVDSSPCSDASYLIERSLTPLDLKRIKTFTEQRNNLMNIADIFPVVTILFFKGSIEIALSSLQK
ncbi:MAG: N-acetyltransferase 10, partial [Paramarteilia canceri]